MHQISIKTEASASKVSPKAVKSAGEEKKPEGDDFRTMMKKAETGDKSQSLSTDKNDASSAKDGKTSRVSKVRVTDKIKHSEKGGASLSASRGVQKKTDKDRKVSGEKSGLKKPELRLSAGKRDAERTVKDAVDTDKAEKGKNEKLSESTAAGKKKTSGKENADTGNTIFDPSLIPVQTDKKKSVKVSVSGSEKSGKITPASVRKADTGKRRHASEEKIHKVVDLRSSKSGSFGSAVNGSENTGSSTERHDLSDSGQNDQVRVMTVTVRGGDSGQEFVPVQGDPKQMLSAELKERLNDSIVKQSSIVLKDKDAGEIRLILKPESLGKVRIRLHLEDNNLTGRIIVDNPHVKDVFENNMFRLEKAFSDSGFSMGSMDVSVGEKGDGKPRQKSGRVNGKVLKIIEDSVPGIKENIYSSNVIDLVV